MRSRLLGVLGCHADPAAYRPVPSGRADRGRWHGRGLARLGRWLARPVAVKLLRPAYAGDEVTLTRFRAEARHAGRLSHPGIAQVYDYAEATKRSPAFLVMELVDGPSLAEVLASSGPLDPGRTADVTRRPPPRCRPRTRPACCTGTSSRATCCSPGTAR